MKKITTFALAGVLTVSLSGCANMNKQDVGVLTGGAIGGAVGSLFGGGSGKILATAGGAVLGAVIGGSIGHSMDEVDQMKMQQALESNRIGQASSWHNPDNGNTYTVKPTRTYRQSSQPCREFTMKGIINGKEQTIYGKACRKADGSWKMK
jgi:surface antigen